jgi:hypothetical protein
MGGFTRAVSEQRLGKYVPVARHRFIKMQKLDYNNGRAVFFTFVPKGYKRDEIWSLVTSDWTAVVARASNDKALSTVLSLD